ncbi:MAG TPA: UbiA prenyltransferase family protein [Dokdonella sp.]|uniref:UbiA prenyltransferase family protein n=1 Tax=Dokdonella sp. TaxID=2291710 RepID=UPI0025B8CE9B|nr:UbiA prenyltransferase family protein [Dokdonella sp.]MBX3691047.1 UbiA prenyltransferase family protein [Dokdonella sp.]MCW5566906.1 UbiA prenyltransferase family protein [Dokdonella sp.]HNR91857.1 UbiA prenyltransferase family protein [Dokdonella sp.]
MRATASALVELARPGQWLKNGFVLLPLFFGHALLSAPAVRGALLATLAFCLASSAVYAFNDARDVERDRRHPDKCRRPLARGALSLQAAFVFAALAAVAALALGAIATPAVAVTIGAYLALNLAYSLGLKRVAWLDVILVASGFALRIIAGGFGAGVPLTPWILVMGFLLALMLALGKRHGDLVHVENGAAHATDAYHATTIEHVLAVLAGAVFVAYVFYTLSPDVTARHGHRALVYSAPWVALGVARYLILVFRHAAGGDPSRLAVRDPWLLGATIGWLATLGVILYT